MDLSLYQVEKDGWAILVFLDLPMRLYLLTIPLTTNSNTKS